MSQHFDTKGDRQIFFISLISMLFCNYFKLFFEFKDEIKRISLVEETRRELFSVGKKVGNRQK